MPAASGGGGGRGAGDIRAGGSFWETYLKDGIGPELERTGDKLKKFDRLIKKVGSFSFAGAFLGGLAGGATIVGVLNSLGQATAAWVKGAKELAAATDRVRNDLERSGKAIEIAQESSKKWRDALPDSDIGRAGKIESLTKDIEAQEQHLAELLKKLVLSNPRSREFHEYIAGNPDPKLTAELRAIRNDPGPLDDAIVATAGKKTALMKELEMIQDRSKDPAFVGEINKATFALEAQIETWGLTGAAAERALLKMRGANDAMLASFDAASEELRERRRTSELDALRFEGRIGGLKEVIGKVLRDPRHFEMMEYMERGGGSQFQGIGKLLGNIPAILGGKQFANSLRDQAIPFLNMPFFFAEMAGKIGPALQSAMNSVSSRGSFGGNIAGGEFAFGDSVQVQENILREIKDHLARKVGEEVAKQFRVR